MKSQSIAFKSNPNESIKANDIIKNKAPKRFDVSNLDNDEVTDVTSETTPNDGLGLTKFKSSWNLPLYAHLQQNSVETATTLNGYLQSIVPSSEKKAEKEIEPETKCIDCCKPKDDSKKLGTLFGVFFPTVQHILGVLMFLRLFWIVGIMGILPSLGMVGLCILCTFLTSISMSAIATNGIVQGGGSYFMLSRNLGPEIGAAVGLLFYFANTVATSMYLVGGVEILLVYLAPQLPQIGTFETNKANNFRLYASLLLVTIFTIVAMGVRFVQYIAPFTLVCVLISVVAILVGSFLASPAKSPEICILGTRLLTLSSITINNKMVCNKTALSQYYCSNKTTNNFCDEYFRANDVQVLNGVPGFFGGVWKENLFSKHLPVGAATDGNSGVAHRDVMQDSASTFFMLLAIYFPSVTGIMTGSNMSGDLHNPQKSIPSGTLAAQLFTSFIYMALVVVFGGSINRYLLLDKYGESLGKAMVISKLAWPHSYVLLIGSFTSTYGAALQCLCSAPRLLHSIAKDDVLPFLNIFRITNSCGEPFLALILSLLISEAAILIGDIEHIAPVVDFFFLVCYGFVNIACALQTLLKTPNWRPRFKYYHWSLSLLGAFLCLFIMFATYWYYALVVMVLCIMLYKYVEYNGAKKEWGDGLSGLHLQGAQVCLINAQDNDPHTKNWRPQILVFIRAEEAHQTKVSKMLGFVGQLKGGGGLVISTNLIQGSYLSKGIRDKSSEAKEKLRDAMARMKVKGFAQSVICSDIVEGISTMIQCSGIGPLRANTIVVGWPNQWKDDEVPDSYLDFMDAIYRLASFNMCIMIPKGVVSFPERPLKSGTIDVWWIIHDGGLLILLPFLLKKHIVWSRCSIRVFAIATEVDNNQKLKERLEHWIYQLRIKAEVHIVDLPRQDITPFAHEKTIQMEKRAQFLKDLHVDMSNLAFESLLTGSKGAEAYSISDAIQSENKESSNVDRWDDIYFTPIEFCSCHEPNTAENLGEAVLSLKKDGSQKPFNVSNSNNPTPNIQKSIRVPDKLVNTNPGIASSVCPSCRKKQHNSKFIPGSTKAEMRAGAKDTSLQEEETHDNKLNKVQNAMRLNEAILEKSAHSQLTVLSLPPPPKVRGHLYNYMQYLELLTEGLERVLLIRGSGKEVITAYI